MFLFSIIQFVSFPNREDSILFKNNAMDKDLVISASGSIGYYYNRKCILTHPNATIYEDKKNDWCSNIAQSPNEKPWISFTFNNKQMKVKGYSVRNGCCYYSCCCTSQNNIIDYDCCCRLYSFSLQGSNDNKTWNTIHKVEKHSTFYFCKYESYEFKETIPYKYIRFIQDEEYPGCNACMALNQIDLYGSLITSNYFESFEDDENEESISIIGKVNRNI